MPTLAWLEIAGFRSFSVAQRLDFTEPLALIWGGNSQGKTSIAEAIEFLLTGDTVRRTLLGGDQAEYYASLRCVHHPDGEAVTVSAGIVDTTGQERLVERTLDADYGRGQECATTLTVDGVARTDLADLGIVLAEPPLRAPVLFQHSVRYALSARPSDRLAYFKALLELADLDALASGIGMAVNKIAAVPTAIEGDLATCLADADLADALAPLRDDATSATTIASVTAAVGAAFRALGEEEATLGENALLDGAVRLEAALDRRDERRFDFAAWRPGTDRPVLPATDLSAVDAYSELATKIDAETSRLTTLFEAVLAIPAYATLAEPTDCPVCGTEDALTPKRVEALRAQLSETEAFRGSQRQARAAVDELVGHLTRASRAVAAVTPPIAMAAEAEVERARASLAGILGREVDLAPTMDAVGALGPAVDAASASLAAATTALHTVRARIGEGRPADAADALEGTALAVAAVDAVAARRAAFLDAATSVLTPATEALAAQSGSSAYRALVRLARDCDGLIVTRRRRAATDAVRAEYAAALRDIERAKLAVFNAKFAGMNDEIKRWWQLLRPDEPVEFHRAAPRGQGRRAMSLEAVLHGKNEEHVVRDALGILSDSQLNALGLSAFLARASLQGIPLIVLDDPVQSGDEAHRDTFIDYVVPALLDADFQVIVTTFDHSFRSLLAKATPVDGFQVDLDEPTLGSVVVLGTHSAAALLNEAKAFLQEGQSLRAAGAWKLRVAAEAVAKEILVSRRSAAGERASLADYAKWTLEKLVPELKPHLTDDKDQRWWNMISERLSPGSHDDAPPERATLRLVYNGLKVALKTNGS